MTTRLVCYTAMALLLGGAAGGCNLSKFTVDTTAPVLKRASGTFAEEKDVEFARLAAPGTLKTAEGFLASAPENRDLLEVLARGYLEYAFGFLEDQIEALPNDDKHEAERAMLKARATEFYDRAFGFAMRLIATRDKGFGDAFKKDLASAEAATQKLDKKSALALLYAGLALASSINLNLDDMGRLVDLPKATALIKRSHDLDSSLYNGGAAMALGLISCARGKAIGGDPDAGLRYFDEAIKASDGKYLMARVLKARQCGAVTQDRALFESTLKEVQAAPADALPAERLANELAKRRAGYFLHRVDELF